MEGSDDAAEAALGLSPQLFVDEILDTIGEVRAEAFDYCLQEAAAPGVLGATKAAQKAAELERGLDAICHVVKDVLDKRMTFWEKYCLQHCFTVPEGFRVPEDDNSCAKNSQKDGTSDSDLDVEFDSLRRKVESANTESENLQRELSSLERQTTYKRKLDSSIAEIQKLFEGKSVQKNFEDLAKAIPILQQKIMGMKKKRTETGSLVDQQVWSMNGLRDSKHLALDQGFIARTEDIQEIINILQNE
ncbi:protein MIS12 homolog [Phragmites australis]|uniref:protein MIS12 homolog n=1 Tax=Phragmites australis TaxID=29695 RepID=UPI002D79BC3C|nr:protein MIS12 homolog [Phragmites australis]